MGDFTLIARDKEPSDKILRHFSKVAYVALYAPFKRTKNEKEFGIQAEFFLFGWFDFLLTNWGKNGIIK